jgi:hypothetical protein
VSEEQGGNFITVLHNGQNVVVPWPVIQSRDFYLLFNVLRGRLLRQPLTHRTAGEFLLTLKTLMAKLKAQDWGALDRKPPLSRICPLFSHYFSPTENLTKHRVGGLNSLLPVALATGYTEIDPEPEPLKVPQLNALIESF